MHAKLYSFPQRGLAPQRCCSGGVWPASLKAFKIPSHRPGCWGAAGAVAGEAELADRYFARLQTDFGARGSVADFVESTLREGVESDLESGVDLESALKTLYYNVYSRGVGIDRPDVAERFHSVVDRLRHKYELRVSFEEIQARALTDYLYAAPVAASLHDKSRAWIASDPNILQMVEKRSLPTGTTVRQFVEALSRREGLDANELFPPAL